ncbi:hypothetical protein [Burkholderia sp. Bp9010]|uniref:hypothetical protein n=1 Tax=Burkholderia sp. Bp9010 TaxID=2184560 RepID=UPI0011CF2DDE|nr:hypothetical protein [Burkholderia sp. Bp9010]
MTHNDTYNLADFLHAMCDKKIDLNDEIYKYLCNVDLARLDMWIARLSKIRNFQINGNSKKSRELRGKKSALVGKVFERLVRVLLDGCNQVLVHNGNIRSTISEIDFNIELQPLAQVIQMFQGAGAVAIGEAKCVDSGPKTEWINEFCGVLQAHNSKLGILFTACAPRVLRTEHRTAIALHSAKGSIVVPFGISQINQVKKGDNFLKLLSHQHALSIGHINGLAI